MTIGLSLLLFPVLCETNLYIYIYIGSIKTKFAKLNLLILIFFSVLHVEAVPTCPPHRKPMYQSCEVDSTKYKMGPYDRYKWSYGVPIKWSYGVPSYNW